MAAKEAKDAQPCEANNWWGNGPARIRSPEPGMPLYGCEHLEQLYKVAMTETISFYKMILRRIFDGGAPLIPQTTKSHHGRPEKTCLTPTYLCVQCSSILTEDQAEEHGMVAKHRIFLESRGGCLYCQLCEDFVYDPTLDRLRTEKVSTGTFVTHKRKHDEMFSESLDEDSKFISLNTTPASCRADGLRGIYNAGATCYQNVILQTFLHNPLLRNYYLSDGHRAQNCRLEAPTCLSCEIEGLFQDFYGLDSTNGYTAASILAGFWMSDKKAFELLVTNKEQDAHEFFQFLAEELHDRNGDGTGTGTMPETGSEHMCKCIIHQTFYGKLQRQTTCQNCKGVTSSVESFLDLGLGLESLPQKKGKKAGGNTATTLVECLNMDLLRADKCEYRCPNCDSMQEAKRDNSIKLLPNVLSIQLKRFEFKQKSRSGSGAKIETMVDFPLTLNMLPYTTRARTLDALDKVSHSLARACTYDLMSVVVHVGDLNTGHYVVYCRVGDQWFRFNDQMVELASVSEVLSAKAYLLFYLVRSLA